MIQHDWRIKEGIPAYVPKLQLLHKNTHPHGGFRSIVRIGLDMSAYCRVFLPLNPYDFKSLTNSI
jgi:hypothetical protein